MILLPIKKYKKHEHEKQREETHTNIDEKDSKQTTDVQHWLINSQHWIY